MQATHVYQQRGLAYRTSEARNVVAVDSESRGLILHHNPDMHAILCSHITQESDVIVQFFASVAIIIASLGERHGGHSVYVTPLSSSVSTINAHPDINRSQCGAFFQCHFQRHAAKGGIILLCWVILHNR